MTVPGLRRVRPEDSPARRSAGRRSLAAVAGAGQHLTGASWTVVDQVLSALSNLAISLAVGRAGGQQLLGSFTVLFTVYLLALGFQRSLVSEPLMAQPIGDDEPAARTDEASALLCAGVYALATSAGTAVVGAVLGSPTVLALALVLPFLLVQDALRYVALRTRQSRRAAAIDAIWLLAVVLAWPLLLRATTAVTPILLWGAGAAVACVWGLWTTEGRARLGQARVWWRTEARRLGGLLAFDSVVHAVAGQGVTLALAGILGLGAFGQLRGTTLLLGPAGTALVAFNAFVLPRLASRAGTFTNRQAVQLSAASGMLALVVVATTVALGPLVGRLLFGGAVEVRYAFLVPLGAGMVVGSFTTGFVLHLKALRRMGLWTVMRLANAVLSVPLVIWLASNHGLRGAVIGLGLATGIGGLLDMLSWWLTVRRGAPATGQ